MTISQTFLEACEVAGTHLSSAQVGERWDHPSALEKMTVGDLAGHLVRAVTSVVAYMERPVPEEGDLLDAPAYFLSVELNADLDSELHVAVRTRASLEAEGGHTAVVERWSIGVESLRSGLSTATPDARIAALGGRTMRLEDYLVTRLVEIVAHTDDLAASLGTDPPAFGQETTALVIDCLMAMARRTHGDLAVIRGLIRRERDSIEALRVF
jgi:hypothetical protein